MDVVIGSQLNLINTRTSSLPKGGLHKSTSAGQMFDPQDSSAGTGT